MAAILLRGFLDLSLNLQIRSDDLFLAASDKIPIELLSYADNSFLPYKSESFGLWYSNGTYGWADECRHAPKFPIDPPKYGP